MRPTVGIRELRQHLSRYLRRVEQGETFDVTERGRRVAVLGPLPERMSIIDKLVADGHATRATRDPRAIRAPEGPVRPKGQSLSDVLAQLRADER